MPNKDDDMPFGGSKADDFGGEAEDAGGMEDLGGDDMAMADEGAEAGLEDAEGMGESYESPAAALEAAIAEHGTGDAQALIDWMSEYGFEVSGPGGGEMEEAGLAIEVGAIPAGPLGEMRDKAAANAFGGGEGAV